MKVDLTDIGRKEMEQFLGHAPEPLTERELYLLLLFYELTFMFELMLRLWEFDLECCRR